MGKGGRGKGRWNGNRKFEEWEVLDKILRK